MLFRLTDRSAVILTDLAKQFRTAACEGGLVRLVLYAAARLRHAGTEQHRETSRP